VEQGGILGAMPTRKQRRRRAKEQRHEYEVVYLDDEGNEVEVDPDEEGASPGRSAARDRPERKPESKRGTGRGGRPLVAPTWQKSARRALIMAPFFFAFLLVIQRNVTSAIVVSLFYAAVFIPFSYGIDKLAYRSQLKRLERKS
jgi:hypothetical protein